MRVVAILGTADRAVLRVAQSLGEVTALAISPSALGATSAAMERVRLWDDELAELPPVGADREAVLATVLAAAARRLEAQLFVIAETATGYLGAAVAEQLNLSHLSQVVDVALVGADGASPQLRVVRRCLHGVQRLHGPPAAVLCVVPATDGAAEPTAAAAPATPETLWNLAELGLTRSELPRPLVRVVSPAQRTLFAPRQFDNLDSLVARLRQDGLG
jgi:electron transfer flavoprotein alpha/beta subunit